MKVVWIALFWEQISINNTVQDKTCHLQKDEVYLNLVLDYVPETVYRVSRHYSKAKQTIPIIYVKVCASCLLCNLYF